MSYLVSFGYLSICLVVITLIIAGVILLLSGKRSENDSIFKIIFYILLTFSVVILLVFTSKFGLGFKPFRLGTILLPMLIILSFASGIFSIVNFAAGRKNSSLYQFLIFIICFLFQFYLAFRYHYGYILILSMIYIMVFISTGCGAFVYYDAQRKGLNKWLWTLIAVFIPNFIGLIIYVIVRESSKARNCPSCGNNINGGDFRVCPYCGAMLKNTCPSCGRIVDSDWKVCPYCSHELN